MRERQIQTDLENLCRSLEVPLSSNFSSLLQFGFQKSLFFIYSTRQRTCTHASNIFLGIRKTALTTLVNPAFHISILLLKSAPMLLRIFLLGGCNLCASCWIHTKTKTSNSNYFFWGKSFLWNSLAVVKRRFGFICFFLLSLFLSRRRAHGAWGIVVAKLNNLPALHRKARKNGPQNIGEGPHSASHPICTKKVRKSELPRQVPSPLHSLSPRYVRQRTTHTPFKLRFRTNIQRAYGLCPTTIHLIRTNRISIR